MTTAAFLIICFTILGVAQASVAPELIQLLKSEEMQNSDIAMNGLREELKKDLGTLMNSIDGDVEQYIPAPIRTAECHVEFQVTEMKPGHCIRLPGNRPACKTEEFISINYNDCS